MEEKFIKEALLAGNYVSGDDMRKAEEYAKKNRTTILDFLFAGNLITKDILGQAMAELYGVPYADLNSYQPAREQVLKIPEETAKKYKAVIFAEDAAAVEIATDNPPDPDILRAMQTLFPEKKIIIAYSLTEDIAAAFVYYRKKLGTRFEKIIESQKRVAPEIVDQIIEDAIIFRASDIHFEPQESEVVIRFRVDGVLQEAGRLAKEYYDNILNRIKVQAKMRIDEHYAAQDGAIRYARNGQTADMRINVMPTMDGEKISIRLLAEYVRRFSLGDLGLLPENEKILVAAADKPFGMILVTGPTGSGKTTTLYSLIKLLNTPDINITTIEDPVEYKIPGINQIQVNSRTDITFAKGLRSIARQDPDIILVGEVRDKETAEIAVNAALTGHLLLSTFHSNDAATAIPRLLDMGIEPFLMASTLELIIAQRLVRRICETCRTSYEEKFVGRNAVARNYFSAGVTLYKGKGCPACNGLGYRGRTAIFEFIAISREMKDLIMGRPSTEEIWSLARKGGSVSIFEDGVKKVESGVTSLEELLRVAEPLSNGSYVKKGSKDKSLG